MAGSIAEAQNRRLQDLKRNLERTKLVFIGKQQELAKAEKQKVNTETLRHKLTPVSREVNDDEIHFHVKENRVAYVPIDGTGGTHETADRPAAGLADEVPRTPRAGGAVSRVCVGLCCGPAADVGF